MYNDSCDGRTIMLCKKCLIRSNTNTNQGQGDQVCLGWSMRRKIAAPENWNSGQAGILQDYETVKTERDFGNGH